MPKRQVIRSQVMAANSAQMTRSCVECSGATMPFPTVAATAVPVNAPTRLRTPAMSTAVPGASTRVATEVAMALAVSWKPLIKSKMRAMATIRTNVRNAGLNMLHHDPLQCVSDVLGAVGGALQILVQFSPADGFDEGTNLSDAIELSQECLIEHLIGFALQPLDLYCAAKHLLSQLHICQ